MEAITHMTSTSNLANTTFKVPKERTNAEVQERRYKIRVRHTSSTRELLERCPQIPINVDVKAHQPNQHDNLEFWGKEKKRKRAVRPRLWEQNNFPYIFMCS